MGCTGCSVAVANGTPKGCGSKGNCATGGCNRMNTFDWLSQMEVIDVDHFDIVEISFKNGSRKDFFHAAPHLQVHTGDMVAVDVGHGYDIGEISLSGELVRMQMKRKKVKEAKVIHSVIRRANVRDLERLAEARAKERETLVKARAIARSLKLDMKMGDVEYQGDNRKATFFYTANGRVDFRELIRHYAQEFRVKIEMRQIGARQESARIGGLGSCGRELCCSTWLTDFKSVSTSAARYQNLAINQAKLSGQCGRLKCCLNFELDTYMEAVKSFPKKADRIQTEAGMATLVKTDIFKQLMFYTYTEGRNRGKLYALSVDQVKEVQEMNKKGRKPLELGVLSQKLFPIIEEEHDYEDVTGVIELPPEKRRKKRRKGRSQKKNADNRPTQDNKGRAKNRRPNKQSSKKRTDKPTQTDQVKESSSKQTPSTGSSGTSPSKTSRNKRRNNRRRKNRGPNANTRSKTKSDVNERRKDGQSNTPNRGNKSDNQKKNSKDID